MHHLITLGREIMTNLKFIFRADNTNVGDWWSPPWKYFPFKPGVALDILDTTNKINPNDTLIIGGGGLGNEFFRPYLEQILESRPNISILWGTGVDAVAKPGQVLGSDSVDLYGDYFNQFDEQGIRVFEHSQKFRYVPCASCMNNHLYEFREKKPSDTVGVYNHKRVPLMDPNNPFGFPVCDNSGNNFVDKLNFLSRFEYIVTNTYHGVYWATLLKRKVVCIPFKSGLFSFKYSPVYCYENQLTDDHFDRAKIYEDALEDSRRANLDYYFYLTEKYDLV